MKITLYKTPVCPKCKVLCAKLDRAGLSYEICDDIELMESMGILSVPVLDIDGEQYDFGAAVKWLNEVIK